MNFGFGVLADENGASLKAGRKNGQNFQCAKCGKWYSTKNIMLRHMNHECGVEKNIQCKYCSKMFLRKWNLKQHVKRIHENTGGSVGGIGMGMGMGEGGHHDRPVALIKESPMKARNSIDAPLSLVVTNEILKAREALKAGPNPL